MRTCVWCSKKYIYIPMSNHGRTPNFCSQKCINFWMEKIKSTDEIKIRPQGYVPQLQEQLKDLIHAIHKQESAAKTWDKEHPFTVYVMKEAR